MVSLATNCVGIAVDDWDRVYAFLSLYLIICSFWLTGLAFKVGSLMPGLEKETQGSHCLQYGIAKQLAAATSTSEIVADFFKPPIGALIAAILSTFGIWLIACLLYVRMLDH